ncbi:MAG: primary-amine oxidase [Rhodospirillaceae bacterium]|jgi:primary-amine oxidase|nr:primary-amine oxidase [Rhodospirillaceae bacterium]MBT5193169.1 primary-amine oxidase [Rhodospirillaceae bacterium]MBT5895876.1 primary-amine oxidase [Rhodospirillaceae bacterium]MBT6430416.1 primary-amine oxidase [Rhodospirillaceae bacterium]MBT7758593.1 primary-amine oxidase [Rhodospirillaceae bacterium]
MNVMTKGGVAAYHPLDPLSADEVNEAADIIRGADFFNDATKFETIELHYPDKTDVLAWDGAGQLPRLAFVCIYDTNSGAVRECLVDLDRGERLSATVIPNARTAVVVDEIVACAENVAQNEEFIAAMARRGITDLSNIQVDPFSAGNFGFDDEADHRIVHCWVYHRNDPFDNGYAHPVEGLNVIYDLNRGAVLQVLDRTTVDIPMEERNYSVRYDRISAMTRDDLKAIAIGQPDGPSFTVAGNQVNWLNWQFHVEFKAREGLVLNDLRFKDGGEVRPLFHRASVAEMVVPYGDPSYGHYRKNAFDVGEYGIGRLANSLTIGCDCRGHIHYFDGIVNDTTGAPVVIENAICMHEEDEGMLWKHTDYMTMDVETRRSRRLIISSVATVGNYEYGFFWSLYLDGTIALEVKLTGIMNTAGLNDVSGDKYGTQVSPGVMAQNHLHLFCARLDAAIDGAANNLVEVNVVQDPPGPDNPWGNAFHAERTVLKSEMAARRDRNADTERYWKITNPNRQNRMGGDTGYKLMAPSMVRPFNHGDTLMAKRAAFTRHHIWATPYRTEERYPAGVYVNQSNGEDGIETWTAADRNIENTDIVVWHTFGIMHLPRLEDFPVQPVVRCGFALVADGFFDENPTLDMPPSTDGGNA